MNGFLTGLVVGACLLSTAAAQDRQPARGELLVATEQVQGDVFGRTVVLLLHYERSGAMGLVINRPTEIDLDELTDDDDTRYVQAGRLFWGGPVQMNTLRALLRTDAPPEGAEAVVGSIYQVEVDAALAGLPTGPGELRVFMGYAGWAPGQLDHELARGSWHVVPASDELVFAKEPQTLWKRLTPSLQYRAAIEPQRSAGRADTGYCRDHRDYGTRHSAI
ncbi:MAG: YqgE/AlgH family protein [Woeseiaceae bacterium]|nr:YqgE/AlgH family protein [Woeseiaceae bacterium]